MLFRSVGAGAAEPAVPPGGRRWTPAAPLLDERRRLMVSSARVAADHRELSTRSLGARFEAKGHRANPPARERLLAETPSSGAHELWEERSHLNPKKAP